MRARFRLTEALRAAGYPEMKALYKAEQMASRPDDYVHRAVTYR